MCGDFGSIALHVDFCLVRISPGLGNSAKPYCIQTEVLMVPM